MNIETLISLLFWVNLMIFSIVIITDLFLCPSCNMTVTGGWFDYYLILTVISVLLFCLF